MLDAQPDADAEIGEGGEAGAGHEEGFSISGFSIGRRSQLSTSNFSLLSKLALSLTPGFSPVTQTQIKPSRFSGFRSQGQKPLKRLMHNTNSEHRAEARC